MRPQPRAICLKGFQRRIGTPFFQLTNGSKEVTASTPPGGDPKVSLLGKDGNEIAPVSSSEASKDRGDQRPPRLSTSPTTASTSSTSGQITFGPSRSPTPSSQTA